jgi:hypothetical protein
MEKHKVSNAPFKQLLKLKSVNISLGPASYEVRPFFLPTSDKEGITFGMGTKETLMAVMSSPNPDIMSILKCLPVTLFKVKCLDEDGTNYVTIDFEQGNFFFSLVHPSMVEDLKQKMSKSILDFINKN